MKRLIRIISVIFPIIFLAPVLAFSAQAATVKVNIPDEDRFEPYVITVHVGDTVQWVNNDTDDHTVVSNDKFTTAGHRGTNHIIPGTQDTGQPGTFSLTFNKGGKFVYYCRFHSHLDKDKQPMAPGPDGGIQDSKGNFGTPMNGVIVVLPANQ